MSRELGLVWYHLVANQRMGDLILAWAKCCLHPLSRQLWPGILRESLPGWGSVGR